MIQKNNIHAPLKMNIYQKKLKEIQSHRLTAHERFISAIKFFFISIFSFAFFGLGLYAIGKTTDLLEPVSTTLSFATAALFGMSLVATCFLFFGQGLEQLTRSLSGVKKHKPT